MQERRGVKLEPKGTRMRLESEFAIELPGASVTSGTVSKPSLIPEHRGVHTGGERERAAHSRLYASSMFVR